MTYEMIPVANWSIQELFLTLSLPTSSLLRSGMLNFPLLHSLFVCFHLTTPTTITSPFPSPSPNTPQALHPPSPSPPPFPLQPRPPPSRPSNISVPHFSPSTRKSPLGVFTYYVIISGGGGNGRGGVGG